MLGKGQIRLEQQLHPHSLAAIRCHKTSLPPTSAAIRIPLTDSSATVATNFNFQSLNNLKVAA